MRNEMELAEEAALYGTYLQSERDKIRHRQELMDKRVSNAAEAIEKAYRILRAVLDDPSGSSQVVVEKPDSRTLHVFVRRTLTASLSAVFNREHQRYRVSGTPFIAREKLEALSSNERSFLQVLMTEDELAEALDAAIRWVLRRTAESEALG